MDEISVINIAAVALSTLCGFLVYARMHPSLRYVFYASAFALCTEILALLLQAFNLPTGGVFFIANPVETILFTLFFTKIIGSRIVTWISFMVCAYMILACLLNLFQFYEQPNTVTYFSILKGLILTVLSIAYIHHLFRMENPVEMVNPALVTVSTGILFYSGFSAVFFSICIYQMHHHISLSSITLISPFLYVMYFIFQCSILYTFVQILVQNRVRDVQRGF